jgi:UDP-N-acetylglucosamine:LPS N-acetylglucosamine transferase
MALKPLLVGLFWEWLSRFVKRSGSAFKKEGKETGFPE